MAFITVSDSVGGYLPTLVWGEGEDMEREAYALGGFQDLAPAERAARRWADEREIEYRPYAAVDGEAIRAQAILVRTLREEEGLDLPSAIARAREILAA